MPSREQAQAPADLAPSVCRDSAQLRLAARVEPTLAESSRTQRLTAQGTAEPFLVAGYGSEPAERAAHCLIW